MANPLAQIESPLVGPLFRPVDPESVTAVDDPTVRVGLTESWSTFPVALTSQGGYIAEPTTIGTDAAAPEPIGTGPFVFEEWVRDDFFRAQRNPDYWQEGKPYVDSVEFRILVDPEQLTNTLRSGGADMIQVSDAQSIGRLRDEDLEVIDDGGAGEEEFILLNTEVAPTDDVRVRRALAYAEVGPVSIVLPDTQGDQNEMAYLQAVWSEIGDEVEVVVAEPSTHVLDGLTGNYQALGWRLFGSPDPDGDYTSWDSENAAPQGELALNMARFTDPDFQAALDAGHSTADFDERKAAYDTAQTIMNEQVPYIWESHVVWAYAGESEVRNMGYYALPDGTTGYPLFSGFSGGTKLTDIWLQQ